MKIEQYTIVENEFFFFRKNNPIAISENELKALIKKGEVLNMTESTLSVITNGVN